MLRQRTVLVLGAGASCDYGLPLGTELMHEICRRADFYFDAGTLTSGDQALYNALRHSSFSPEQIFSASRRLAAGARTATSIDDLLHRHSDDPCVVLVGKVAIAQIILFKEKKSLLSFRENDSRRPLNIGQEDWILPFFSNLCEGVTKTNVGEIFQHISVVTFNYDRTFEHYLHHLLMGAYALDAGAASQVMSTLQVTHVYGQAGYLHWQSRPDSVPISFGGDPSASEALSLADRIRTLTEQGRSERGKMEIERAFENATQVIFLGFGFHRQNIEAITHPRSTPKQAFVSTFGMSDADCQVVGDHVRSLLYMDTTPALLSQTSASFVQHYVRRWMY